MFSALIRVRAGHPVAIVYLRAGYAPTDYLDDSYWAGRLAIERSNAVKCAPHAQKTHMPPITRRISSVASS